MARVRCVMMQKDENLLLNAWFRYYGYLFGFENLVVLDNGSRDPSVLETLRMYERAGADIRHEHNRIEDFQTKGTHVRNIIAEWDLCGGYDFALPVDCDEFLAVYTPDGLSCSRTAVHRHFDALTGIKQAFRFRVNLMNVPGRPGCFQPNHYQKTFLAAGTGTEQVDRGFHAITSSAEGGWTDTNFTFLHMHNKPFADLLRHARNKLANSVPLDDPEALRAHKGLGSHLIPYFFMTEQDYHERFTSGVFLRIPGFVNHMRALGFSDDYLGTQAPLEPSNPTDAVQILGLKADEFEHIVPFDGEAYRRLNPDVAAAGFAPLRHYVEYGMQEGRRFTDFQLPQTND
ncbi:glycosyltransferase family 2 protein [Acetobacter fallax]|uniref:Glycosyl transferase family 2 n=1 Tax=Acetobacter fallax TaxID=1737473 RepID=A0ABX0KCJ2_9PROT|nr:glycosyltransferase family 2 protein [Acetobacter fallax]NHO33710.1 hypothetical protein [Acetobacter fallax]NHO37271.1 hypothetical protein [Acetobacter fallax]